MAVEEFNRGVVAYSEAGLEPDLEMKFRRAQLWALCALASEVRALRQAFATPSTPQ